MKYAVGRAHAKPTSFCAAIAWTCVAALEQGGAWVIGSTLPVSPTAT
ncbi:hypothetical protein BH10PSE4_BH10PSE4_38200 [soil metagenome]